MAGIIGFIGPKSKIKCDTQLYKPLVVKIYEELNKYEIALIPSPVGTLAHMHITFKITMNLRESKCTTIVLNYLTCSPYLY